MDYVWWGSKLILKNFIIGTIVKEVVLIPMKHLGKIMCDKAISKFRKYKYFNEYQ